MNGTGQNDKTSTKREDNEQDRAERKGRQQREKTMNGTGQNDKDVNKERRQ